MNRADAVARGGAQTVALTGLVSLAVAMGIGRFAFTPILPMMQDDYGLSVGEGGWLAAANYTGYLAGALSGICARVRPALAIRAALATIVLVTLAMAATSSFPAWILLRAIAGAASAWVLVFTSSWALERLGAEGRLDLGGTMYAGVGVGIAVAGLTCLVLMAHVAHAAEAWRALGAVAGVATLTVWPVVGRGSSRSEAALQGAAASGYGRLVLCYGLFGFGYIVPATFLPLMAKTAMPDPQAFGWAWPMFGLAAALSTISVGGVAKRFGFRGLWMGAALVMAAGVALPLVIQRFAGLLASALAVGGTFMVITMAGLQEARRVAGQNAKAVMAAMTSAFALGQIAGPALVALLAGNPAIMVALACACVLLVASAALLASVPARTPKRTGL